MRKRLINEYTALTAEGQKLADEAGERLASPSFCVSGQIGLPVVDYARRVLGRKTDD